MIVTKTKENKHVLHIESFDNLSDWLNDIEDNLVWKIAKIFLSVLSYDVNAVAKYLPTSLVAATDVVQCTISTVSQLPTKIELEMYGHGYHVTKQTSEKECHVFL